MLAELLAISAECFRLRSGRCERLLSGGDANEPFPSSLCRVKFQGMDGFGELSGAPGAAAELTQNPPGGHRASRVLMLSW
jgi:hypothetical protein